ncbi:hypothetical protein [Clostridium sp.]|uniref:hypothetical protein n=1 Tax=Clostridium sp. TaxID=1506 RepID=UPI00260BAB1F|nr:hypothetical protein [Clostridium sp.]
MKSKEYILRDCVDTEEIFEFLNINAHNMKNVLKNRIKSKFYLSHEETDLIYSKWKTEYMRYKTC